MSVGRDMGWYRYTDNEGGFWSVKIDKRFGDHADLGFGTFDAGDPPLGARYLRRRYIEDPASFQTLAIPVGTPTAAGVTSTGTITLERFGGDPLGTEYNYAGFKPERLRKPRVIRNI